MQNKKLNEWLEKLQQESWQLELLISGFLLSLVIGAKEPLDNVLASKSAIYVNTFEGGYILFFLLIITIAWYIIIINLVVHVLLRSVWIGTIGLRNISGGINLKNLGFSERFEQHLEKKMPSYDRYIENLENFCCLVFAFTFLVVFAIMSIFLYFGFFAFFLKFLKDFDLWIPSLKPLFKGIRIAIAITYFGFGLIYFIDFISLGWVKRFKWFSKIYLPFYKFFNRITLASVYRPIYYNLIDNRLGKKLMLFLIPYLFVLGIYSDSDFNGSLFFPYYSTQFLQREKDYEIGLKENQVIRSVVVSEKYPEDFLEVFVPELILKDMEYRPCYDSLTTNKVGFIVLKDFRDGFNESSSEKNNDSLRNYRTLYDKKTLNCITSHFKITISDSLQKNIAFDFYKHPKNDQAGFLTVIDIEKLKRGKHLLVFKVFDKNNKEYFLSNIPFWKK